MHSSWYVLFMELDIFMPEQCSSFLEIRHKRRITVAAASKILANLTYAYKGYGLSMGTMLAGVCAMYFVI